jgi:hypothetical protein
MDQITVEPDSKVLLDDIGAMARSITDVIFKSWRMHQDDPVERDRFAAASLALASTAFLIGMEDQGRLLFFNSIMTALGDGQCNT